MSSRVRIDIEIILATVILWVVAWQLIKMLADKLNPGVRIIVFIAVTVIMIFILGWLFSEQDRLEDGEEN